MQIDGLRFVIPGIGERYFDHLVADFNGTLAKDGALLYGVEERLRALTKVMAVTVLTADTYGTAHQALDGLGVEVRLCASGEEKAAMIQPHGETTVAIGNGRNDCAMFRVAGLSIGVIGPEGTSGDLIRASTLVTRHICDALDLLLEPLRLAASLRP